MRSPSACSSWCSWSGPPACSGRPPFARLEVPDLAGFFLTYQSLFVFMGLNGLLALSVYCTLCCGHFSLAYAGFMAIGAYAVAPLTQNGHAPFSLALLAGALLPALIAIPLGLPVLRLRG